MNSLSFTGASMGGGHCDNPAPILGIEVGIVEEIAQAQNPDGSGAKRLGSVKVRLKKFETTKEKFITTWAPVTTFMGGSERGAVFLPEKGDEVLVAFESGNINLPYVIGALHSEDDKMPVESNKEMNDVRIIKSRSGLTIKFTDTSGQEKLEIMDLKDGSSSNKITLDLKEKKIEIESTGNIDLKAKGELNLKGDKVMIESSSENVKVMSAKNIELEASSDVNAKATNVKVKASGMLDLESSAAAKVKAGGNLGLSGAQITLG